MSCPLFLGQLKSFIPCSYALCTHGLSSLQKCTTSIKMIAYGVVIDFVDEYTLLSETSSFTCLTKFFCDAITACSVQLMCRGPTNKMYTSFLPSILDEIFRACSDLLIICTGNGRTLWRHGNVSSKAQVGTRCWCQKLLHYKTLGSSIHLFGVSGKMTDLTLVACSPLFPDLLDEVSPIVEFQVNGHEYFMCYYIWLMTSIRRDQHLWSI